MKRLLLTLGLALTLFTCHAQKNLTTFILIRHAEKANDGTRNPALTPQGIERAEKLKDLLVEAGVTAIYSTPYKRTQATVAPLAQHLGIEVGEYDPQSMAFIKDIMTKHNRCTIVV